MTYQQLQRLVTGMLRDSLVPAPETDALFLLQHVTGTDLTHYLMIAADAVPEETKERCLELARLRACRIPLQHLTGTAFFMGREFTVNEHVLIPRPDTEVLAAGAIEVCRQKKKSGRILDLCTGSGILAVTLALELPSWQVEASDISHEALLTARENAARLGADVRFYEGDLFGPVSGIFDMIVSNPPYIPTGVIEELEPEVRDHDPFTALDGGADGLDFYRRIAEKAPAYLKKGGWLLCEIGHDQEDAVYGLLAEKKWQDVQVFRDLAGKARVVRARTEECV